MRVIHDHKLYAQCILSICMKKRAKHNFPNRFFAVERQRDDYKDIVYGEKGQETHNHIGLTESGFPAFHEVRDKNVEISWISASITNVGHKLVVSFSYTFCTSLHSGHLKN